MNSLCLAEILILGRHKSVSVLFKLWLLANAGLEMFIVLVAAWIIDNRFKGCKF